MREHLMGLAFAKRASCRRLQTTWRGYPREPAATRARTAERNQSWQPQDRQQLPRAWEMSLPAFLAGRCPFPFRQAARYGHALPSSARTAVESERPRRNALRFAE